MHRLQQNILLQIEWVGRDFAYPCYLSLHGVFGFLLVLGGWEIERFIEHHSPIPCSTLHPEVLKDFSNKNKFLKWHSQIAQSVWFLTKAFVCLLSPTSKKAFVELMVERKARQTCFKYFAKPKIEPNRLNKSYNHDREVHVCGRVVDGMGEMKYSMYDLSLLIIFRHG